MFVFGVCLDSRDTFDRHCLPAIAAFGGADATLITSDDHPVAATYNQMLEACLDLEDVEAIVLLRQDVEITDPHFRRKVREAFDADPQLAVLGPGERDRSPVDSVDGRCLVLRPDLAARMRFDAEAFAGPSGYDVDFCYRVRESGGVVAVVAIDVVAHDTTVPADAGLHSAAAVWQGRRAAHVGQTAAARLLNRRPDGTDSWPSAFEDTAPGHDQAPYPGPPGAFQRFTPPDLIDHLPPQAHRVLELGCGAGVLGARIAQAGGLEVTGVEADPRQAQIARALLHEVVELDLNAVTELPFADASFDAIVLDGLLDRVVDPLAVLTMATRCLGPGGKVIATVPNVKHWSVVLPLLVDDRWEYETSSILHPAGLRHFTMAQAADLFHAAGLGDFDVCAAQQVPLEDPDLLEPLVECLAGYGADPDETRVLLNAYDYLLVAGRSPA